MVDFNSLIKALVKQSEPEVYTDGTEQELRQTRLGQLLTADWHQNLIMSGRAFSADYGTIAATDITALTGNAAVDLDQPEIVIGVDTGFLIPMEIEIDIQVNDDDAYDDITRIAFFADRTDNVADAAATATVETPLNMLDGGESFSGRSFSIVTSNITAPVPADYLGGATWTNIQLAAEVGGLPTTNKHLHKIFTHPKLLRGPCSIVGWITGTNTPTFTGSVKFAHVPASWFA